MARIIGGLFILGVALAGCTGVFGIDTPIADSSWTLKMDGDKGLVDLQHPEFGRYPNPKSFERLEIELQADGRLCATSAGKQFCGGPIQGIPYLTILNAKPDQFCVRVVDIFGNDVRQGCMDGPAPEAYVPASYEGTTGTKGGGVTTVDEVSVGVALVIKSINDGLAKIGLKTRLAIPTLKGLANFKQGDMTVGKGTCEDVKDYLDDEFSDDHPGTDDYVFGKEAIKECLDKGSCRIGQLVTRSMAQACNNIPDGVRQAQAASGIVGGAGNAVGKLCSGNNSEIDKCRGSPLVLDLAGDGLQLAGLGSGVSFPLIAGRSMNVGWLAGSDDALLALDLDGDGKITSGRELFGEATAPNGFAALARHDDDGDGEITPADAIYERLVAWRDNGDGISQKSELLPLSAVGVRSISLRHAKSDRVDAHGNHLGLVGSASTGGAEVPVIDVWFRMGAR